MNNEDLSVEEIYLKVTEKLGFRLPFKLLMPTSVFTLSNMVSSDIKVGENMLTFKFDPTAI